MANPLYGLLGGQAGTLSGEQTNLINEFKQFKAGISGDPRQQVQELLNSGRMTQEQFNRYQAMATELRKVLG